MATKVTGWFPHDIDTIEDVDIQMLINKIDPAAYGIWWRIVEVLHKHGGSMKIDRLLFAVDRSLGIDDSEPAAPCAEWVISVCVELGLLNQNEYVITSERVMRNLDFRKDVSAKRSEAGRRGGLSNSKASAKQVLSKAKAKSSTVTYTVTDTVTKKKNTPLPPEAGGVLDYLEFLTAWSDWYQHRSELRKPNTEKAAEKQLARLTEIKESGGDPVAIINNAIEKGWQGLYGKAEQVLPTKNDVGELLLAKFEQGSVDFEFAMKYANEWYIDKQTYGMVQRGKAIVDWKVSLLKFIQDKLAQANP